MSEAATEQTPVSVSPAIDFQEISSPFASDPSFLSRDVQLLPIDNSDIVKYSSLELLNAIGDGFRNDEYYDLVNQQVQADLKDAWQNIVIPESIPQCTQIKYLIRRGVPDDLRQKVWKSVSGWTSLSSQYPDLYADALQRAFGTKPPSIIRSYPLFGGLISPSDHFLIDETDEIIKRLLVVIGMEFPTLDYCPVVLDFIQILLAFMNESDTYGVMYCMLTREKSPKQYMLISKHEYDTFNSDFLIVLENLLPKVHKQIIDFNLLAKETRCFWYTWFSRLFVSSFPYHMVLRIFDAYMSEGVKVLYRVAVAVLDLNSEDLLRTATSKEFRKLLYIRSAYNNDVDQLIKRAFTYHIRGKQLGLGKSVQRDQFQSGLPVFYRPKILHPSSIIEDDKFEILWAWVPHHICIMDPFFLYSAEKHGFSFNTITFRCKNEMPLLVIIKSDSGAVFGAYLTHPLSIAQDSFYGDRDCFLWTLSPGTSSYNWTKKNDLFIKGTSEFFCIGGGGSGYGLYIHEEMWGRSDPCDTFDNPPLEPVKPDHFQIVALEIYGFR